MEQYILAETVSDGLLNHMLEQSLSHFFHHIKNTVIIIFNSCYYYTTAIKNAEFSIAAVVNGVVKGSKL